MLNQKYFWLLSLLINLTLITSIEAAIEDNLGNPNTLSSPGILQFTSQHYFVNENNNHLTLQVSRTEGSFGQVTVNYATQSGTATGGSDYIHTESILNWREGDSAEKAINIPILSDNIFENDEILTVNLSNPTDNATLGIMATATVVIEDSFGNIETSSETEPIRTGLVQLAAIDYEVNESNGNVSVTISRINGNEGVAEVSYITQNGTADTQDYIAIQGTIRWLDGENDDKVIRIGIYNDILVEETENFSIKLFNPTGYTQLGSQNEANIAIIDNDVETTLQFTSDNYSVDENVLVATITVSRTGSLSGQVSVNYAISDNTATVNQDYLNAEGLLVWVSGDRSNRSFIIPIKDDYLVEGNETIQLQLFNIEGNAILGSFDEATLTIIEDDTDECQNTEIIRCSWDNNGNLLQNITISSIGSVTGGQLGGTIINEGVIENVTLLADSHIIGGQNKGIIRGNIQGNPNGFAMINNVEIASNTVLNHVIIGRNAIMNNDVILGNNIVFESNSVIPYNINLNGLLGTISTPYLNAIDLRKDVLLNSSRNGIIDAINSLLNVTTLKSSLVLEQNLENGALEFEEQAIYYKILPTNVAQVWGRQIIENNPLEAMGITIKESGELQLVTHTGRKVTLVPIVHDFEALQHSLASFNLNNIIGQINGNIKIFTTGGYYMIRPHLFSQKINTINPLLGIRGINSAWLSNLVDIFLIYAINANESHQQFLYPSAAYPDSLYAQSAGNQVILYLDGRAKLFVGEGNSRKMYQGLFDYSVITSTSSLTQDLQILDIEDVNQDGLSDYRIVYPNGDRQILYQCTYCVE